MTLEADTQPHPSITAAFHTGCGPLYLTLVFEDEGMLVPIKLLPQYGKAGSCGQAHLQTLCDVLSEVFAKDSTIAYTVAPLLTGHRCQYQEKGCMEMVGRFLLAHITREETNEDE